VKTDKICRASESTTAQMKLVENQTDPPSSVNMVTDQDQKIALVLKKLGEYGEPQKNIPFERYHFNQRVQDPGETYDQYRTALRKLAEGCNFEVINPEAILCDCLLFGIRDKVKRDC